MIISFTNVIGAIQSLVKRVITDNLKIWLGFETSQHLGLEQVINGDFSTDSDWNLGTGWDIDEANNKATHTGTGGIIKQALSDLIVGKDYVASVTLNSIGDTSLSNTSFQIRNNADTASVAQLLSSSGDILPNRINYLTLNFTATQVNNIIRVFSEDDIFVTDFSIKQLTQITPDKSGNNNVGELFTGKALDFDGAGDYVDVSGFSMSGNNATFAFWAYIEENEKGDYFFDFYSTSTRFILGFGQTSRELAIYSGGWQDFGNPPQDQWVRIVLTVKGTIAKCFVDGVQLGADKTISAYDFSSPTTAHIAARYTPETFPKYYQGLLSDFQVYDKPWLNEDIAYDYANPQNLVTDRSGTSIGLSNLKGYWHLSEGTGSIAYDSGTKLGTEEIVDGDFPTGTTAWTKGSDTTIGNNEASFDGTASYVSQNILVIGKVYECSVRVKTWVSGAALAVGTAATGSGTVYKEITRANNTTTTFTFTAVATTLGIGSKSFPVEGSIDLVSVKEVISSNNNGTINGATYELAQPRIPQLGMMNFSKDAVATGVTLIPNPNNTSQDILGNAVRDRLNSFNLDGTGYAEVAEVVGLDVTDFSIEAWVKFDYTDSESSTNVIYVNGGVSTSVNTFALATDQDNKVRFIVGGVTLYSTTVFSNNNWVHIAGTRESGALKLYINGNKTPEATGTGNAVVNNTSDLLIGRDTQTNRFYKERISDVRLYDRALTATEVENNYNAGLSAHTN